MAAIEDDDKPKKKLAHEIGQDLALLSLKELDERIFAELGKRHDENPLMTSHDRQKVQAQLDYVGDDALVHAEVEREVVACAGGNAHEREVVRGRCGGHDRQRPITASHAEGICAASCGCLSELCQALAGSQNDRLDTQLAGPLNDTAALGRAPPGPGIDEQHRLPRAADGVPAVTQQLMLDAFSRRCGLFR